MPDINASRPQSCGCGEASYEDCACSPKPLPWGSGQATFPHGAQSPSRAPSPVDTSPAALRALAAKAGLTEPADRMAAPFWAAAARDALRALAAEKEAPSAAIDAVLRDAMASGIGIARIAPEEFFARADEKEAATVKPDLTVGAEVMPVKVVAVMGLRPAPAQESSSIGPALADLRTLAETATPGPWQVMTYRIPFSITRHDGTTCSGEHVGWDIATVRHHPQSHAPERIVTLGIGVTQEPPVPFVHIRPEDADYLAAVSPEVVLALLDEIAALRASLAAAEQERDALRDAVKHANHCQQLTRDEVSEVEQERNAALSALAARYDPSDGDWSQASAEAARNILLTLGQYQSPSMEPGSDSRRDRVAKIIEEALAAAVARAEKAEAERDAARWQPIETAPRDGTLIDLWAGERIADCAWNVPSNCWAERIGAGFGGKHWAVVNNPTYWMPLPAAPANPEDPAHA